MRNNDKYLYFIAQHTFINANSVAAFNEGR